MERIGIAIVGAGPAGLQAAITLSQLNYQPIVFEEHSVIGQPIQCGEGLSIQAFHDFSLEEDMDAFCVREFKKCKIMMSENKAVYGDVHAFSIRRDAFDQYLAKRATDMGVEILLSTKVTKVVRLSDGFQIITSGEKKKEYRCDMLIIAEGYKAKIARDLNFPQPTPLIKALEYKVEGEWRDDLEFYFDAKKYPSGYCWIFPRKGETNVGIATTAKHRKKRLDDFLKEKEITGSIMNKIGGQITMNGPINKLYDTGVIVVGDTAGMVNPIFYGGIRLAMTSGEIAGKIVAHYMNSLNDNSRYNLSNYHKTLKKYQFMKKVNLKCHLFFYSRSNEYLEKLSMILEGKYINRIEKWEKIKVIGKILKCPILLRHPLGLYWIYRGFKIARDWGF